MRRRTHAVEIFTLVAGGSLITNAANHWRSPNGDWWTTLEQSFDVFANCSKLWSVFDRFTNSSRDPVFEQISSSQPQNICTNTTHKNVLTMRKPLITILYVRWHLNCSHWRLPDHLLLGFSFHPLGVCRQFYKFECSILSKTWSLLRRRVIL